MKFVHIMVLDKFIPPFIKFVNENFDSDDHLFLIFSSPKKNFSMDVKINNIRWVNNIREYLFSIIYLQKAKKIVIHGLWSRKSMLILFLMPWILKKCYWVAWGGDFYFPEQQPILRKLLIKKIGHIITYIKGDYELIKKWYHSKAKYHECFMYLSNVYENRNFKQKTGDAINILVGNSAAETNNHLILLEKLAKHKDNNIKIFVPLMYGNKEDYINLVISKGKEIFKEKFIPLTEFMPEEKYLEFLSNMDIGIFGHNRQQGMGNVIQLLGMGKKVYINDQATPWDLFRSLGVTIYSINEDFNFYLDREKLENNKKIIENYFTKERLKIQWEQIFKEVI